MKSLVINPPTQHFFGYTLAELLVTLSITTILLSIALPGFASVIRKIQSETVIYSLANAYQLARSTAIHGHQSVVFCAKGGERACGSDWSRGALVFTDPNSNRTQDNNERMLADLPAAPNGGSINIKAALNKNYLRFMPNGMLENTAGSIVYCPRKGQARDARNMIFSRNGRLRFGEDKNKDGIHENAEGQPLSCPS